MDRTLSLNSPFGTHFGFAVASGQEFCELERILHWQELELISPRAVASRRREFFLGRAAAHAALAQLAPPALPTQPILRGKHNEPLWPAGIVGAITHTEGIAIAAVAATTQANGIGIDLEAKQRQVSWDITQRTCLPSELCWINAAPTTERLARFIMLFSAKESAFKAFFPIAEVFLDFTDVELSWDAAAGQFDGSLRKAAGISYPLGYRFKVGCQQSDGYVFTYLALPPVTTVATVAELE